MKYFFTLLFCLVLMAGVSFAQHSVKDADKAIAAYSYGLELDNQGVVESAIENVMILKSHFPDKDYSPVIRKLQKLTKTSAHATLRVKASIAANYLKNHKQTEDNADTQKTAIKSLLSSVDVVLKG